MRVGLYARVSTGSDDQANALEQQLDRLAAAAAAQGDNSPCQFVDVASGSRDDRPELARLLADCAAGLLSTVIVTRLDRLSRSSAHGAQMLRYFSEPQSPNLIALDDSLDLATPGGRFMGRLLISWAEAETDRLAERTRHGHAFRRQNRKVFGPRPIYGYAFDGEGGLKADEVDFAIAQQAIERFRRDANLSGLLSWFAEERGHQWGNNFSLRRWLCNPTLAGARAYGQSKREVDPETGRKRRLSRPPGDYAEIYWTDEEGKPFQPPLVTREQHAWILSIFAARAEPSGRPVGKGSAQPLTGLIRCMDCSRTMEHHRTGKGGPLTLRCKTAGCPSRWKTIRAKETATALLSYLQMHAAELVRHFDDLVAERDAARSEEEKALRIKIQKLEAMDDPDLQTGLDKKREELARMIQAKGGGDAEAFIQQVEEVKGLKANQLAEKDPDLLRNLLQRYVRAEASQGELTYIFVAEKIRRAGKGRAIDVTGLGVGKSKERMTQVLKGLGGVS